MLEFLRDIFTSLNGVLGIFFAETLNLPEWAVVLLQNLLGAVIVASVPLLMAIFVTWAERKIVGRMQDRLGPNMVGPWGIFQGIPDALKLTTKELLIPAGADRTVFQIAPLVGMAAVVMIWAVMPFAPTAIGTDLDIGALYFVAISAFGTLAIFMAGWASNNKYALLGAFRVVAAMVSYEVPLILALMVPVLLAGTMSMNEIVKAQGMWYVVMAPIPALLFFVANLAEVGRAPFDLIEAESEIVAGYHIEYSSMGFGLFMAAEFVHGFTIAALQAALFFGGWRGPGAAQIPTLGVVYFLLKTIALYLLVVLVRTTVPRLRIDQMMAFCWRFLVPVGLVTLMVVPLVDKIALELSLYAVVDAAALANMTVGEGITANLLRTGLLLATNVLLAVGVMVSLVRFARTQRSAEAATVAAD